MASLDLSDSALEPEALIEQSAVYLDLELPSVEHVAGFVREQRLTARSGVYSNFRILFFLVLLPLLFVVGHDIGNPFVWVAIWLAQGLLVMGTNSGVHEAVHNNLYRSKPVNQVVGMLFGVVTLFYFGAYRGLHLEHHAHTHADGDGEPVNREFGRLHYLVYLLFSGVAFMLMLLAIGFAAAVGRGPRWMGVGNRRRVARINAIVLLAAFAGLGLAFATHPGLTAQLWLAPVLTYFLVFAPMVALPEHQDCQWGPASAFLTTRTTVTNRTMQFLAWGGNFHTAHHLVPSVPGQKLRHLSAVIDPQCSYLSTSYVRWHWSILTGRGRPPVPPFPEPPTESLVPDEGPR